MQLVFDIAHKLLQ